MAVRLCLESRFPMAVWAGADPVLIYNDGYPPVLGAGRHPWALGRPAREVWPDIWDRLGPEVDRVLAQGAATFHADERFVIHRDGRDEETYFTWSLTPVREDDGRISATLNVFQETTRRVLRLLEDRRHLEAVLEAMPAAVVLLDAATLKLSYLNRRAMEIYGTDYRGFDLDTHIAKVQALGPEGSPFPFDELPGIRSVRSGVEIRDVEMTIQRSDGTRTPVLVSSAPLFDADGRASQAVVIFDDITDRKHAEQALREADRRKDHFLAVLSHELRNPLAPIRNSLYILRRAAPGGEQADRAQAVMSRQIDQLVRLVDDLLDVTRITRGKIQLQRRRLELNDLVRHTLEDHRQLFDQAGIALELRRAFVPLHVQGDPNRLAQVIGNLLQNAAKFTPPRGRVEVSVAGSEDGRASVRVADTGDGLTPAMLDQLFEPFMQADSSLDRHKGGLGLGLALVKGLIELHGGDVSAESPGPGRGSVFTVHLPLDTSAGDPAEEHSAHRSQARRRILVIEDNLDGADSLRELLELENQEVQVSYNGPDGITKARAFRPDLVLCDIGLPGMDGYEVARAFRADPGLRDIPLVAVSGYAQPEDLQRAAEAGFDRHLAKPLDLGKLESLLLRMDKGC